MNRYTVEINGLEHEFQFDSDKEAKAVYPNAKKVSGGSVELSEPVGDTVPRVDDEGQAKADAKAKADKDAETKARSTTANKARGAAANKGS